MSTTLVPTKNTRLARFFDDDWPFPQLLGGMRTLEPQIRVEEMVEGDKLVVRAEAPGIDPDKDVDVSIVDGKLLISVERRESTETKDEKNYRSEFRYGSFARSVPLPVGTKPDDIKAAYKDGILEIKVPMPPAEVGATKVKVQRS
jgi:HSP20 family protein